jgi:hypothetical protein
MGYDTKLITSSVYDTTMCLCTLVISINTCILNKYSNYQKVSVNTDVATGLKKINSAAFPFHVQNILFLQEQE